MVYAGALYLIGYLYIVNSLFYIFRKKDITGLSLGATFIAFGYVSIYTGLVKSEHILLIPELFGSDVIINALGCIAIFFNFESVLNKQFKWEKKHYLFLLYPFIQFVFFIPYLLLSYENKITLIKEVISENQITHFSHHFNLLLQLICNSFLALYALIKVKNKYSIKNAAPKYKTTIKISGLFFMGFVLIGTYGFIKILLLSFNIVEITLIEYVIFFSSLFIAHLFVQIWPYYTQYGKVYFSTSTFHTEKYFNQYLDISDIKRIEKAMNILINKKEIYKKDDLKSETLAKELNINNHQLSTFLNQHLNQNFSEFINSKRIEKAKNLIVENPTENIINICYEVGYNSPSAFYAAFKKKTGFAPKNWIIHNKLLKNK